MMYITKTKLSIKSSYDYIKKANLVIKIITAYYQFSDFM